MTVTVTLTVTMTMTLTVTLTLTLTVTMTMTLTVTMTRNILYLSGTLFLLLRQIMLPRNEITNRLYIDENLTNRFHFA
jgi:hypothetical protein